jgi:hypothetical protein
MSAGTLKAVRFQRSAARQRRVHRRDEALVTAMVQRAGRLGEGELGLRLVEVVGGPDRGQRDQAQAHDL